MLVYRICHKKYQDHLFTPGISGRWNSAGKKVLYTAESVSLAFLENMIRRKGIGFNADFRILIFSLPESCTLQIVNIAELSEHWRDTNDYSECQRIGDRWYETSDSLVLKVPSAVLPSCFNYVIHGGHPDFKKVKLVETTGLIPDPRIDEILKNYKN